MKGLFLKKTIIMKNKLIKLLPALLLMIIIVMVVAAFKPAPQTGGNKYATLTFWEPTSNFYKTEIIITYEDGKTEEMELPRPSGAKSAVENNQKVNETINTICNKGYKIVCVTSRFAGIMTTYTLEKL